MKIGKRKMAWDREGVSEVIGTILTLSITVILFSSIIMMVDQFPAPGDKVYTDFTATIEPWNGDWDQGAFIHITNSGGQVMTADWTMVVVTVDSQTLTLGTKGMADGAAYGLGPGVFGHRGPDNGDDSWDTGERWTLFRNGTSINQRSDVSVIILDTGRNALVWAGQIQGARNRFGPIITNIYVDSESDSMRQAPIQFGRPFRIFANAYDQDGDLNVSSVRADLSSILGPAFLNVPMPNSDGAGNFWSDPLMGPNSGAVPIGYHIAVIHASDLSGMHSRAMGRIAVGLDLKDQPNLVVHERNLRLSSSTPFNRQTISITATVMNYGGRCNGTVSFYDVLDPLNDPVGTWIATENFTISDGPDQITRSVRWMATPGGKHTIRVVAEPINAADADPRDNEAFINLTVMPTILLVDDDNHPADFSYRDTASFMKGALDSCDFKYDVYTVGSGKDGPAYSFGEKKLADYDIVIWVTGYEAGNTLRAADRANLADYLNDAQDIRKAGGSLWLVGQSILNELGGTNPAFFRDALRIEDSQWFPSDMGSELRGVAGNRVSDEWATTSVPLINRHPEADPSHARSWLLQPQSTANVTFNQDANPLRGHALNYDSDEDISNPVRNSRIVFFPWEFSRIASTGDQAQVAFRVMNWLGNLGERTGDDLAVSEQTLDPAFVFFNQQVTVKAVIRNNSPGEMRPEIGLFLNGGNEPIAWVDNVTIPGDGGRITVFGNWTATSLGTHVLKWKVDPNNLIPETNEYNNEVPSHIHDGKVFVEFRILVVDDDASDNNGGILPNNDTARLTDALSRLGYMYESHNGVNTTYVLAEGGDGPGIGYLKNYSAVFWVAGNSAAALTDADAHNIERYLLNYRGRVWLSGDDLFSGLSPSNRTSLLNVLGISSVVENQPVSGTMRGVDNSPVSHGMNISIAWNNQADILVPNMASGTRGVFYRSYLVQSYLAVMRDSDSYHAFTGGFSLGTLYGSQPGYVAGDDAMGELSYMILRWMGRPETRNEVRLTERDYAINDWHPQIGNAYILRATVHNVGANDVNLLVRFMDGTVQIGSSTVSISPGTVTSAEIIWTPLFAGSRNIHILADPVGDVDEIFPWFNNNVTFNVYVYFFWDDMESGSDKWTHSSTIMSINGEGPLDFMASSYTSVNTDVMGAWDWSRTSGVQNSTEQSRSHPRSFYMEEPTGDFVIQEGGAAFVSFAIDASGSMANTFTPDGRKWSVAAGDAARAMVANLSDDSIVTIVTYNAGGPLVATPPTTLTPAGRAIVNARLDGNVFVNSGGIHPQGLWGGSTPFWDAVGLAYEQAKAYSGPLYRVVVTLGDGCDASASDQQLMNPPVSNRFTSFIEQRSTTWGPWHDMYTAGGAYNVQGYANLKGKYSVIYDDHPGYWGTVYPTGNRRGLLNSDIPFFNIGMGIEHYDLNVWNGTTPVVNPIENPQWKVMPAWPGGTPLKNYYNVYYDPAGPVAGTVEYNLYQMAETSGGNYFYTPDGADLGDIFEAIGRLVSNGSAGFNQTRSSALPGVRSTNVNKQAVSPAVDLTQYESAKFSFWHKYNMLSGGNGGVIGVEVWDPAPAPGAWKFLYIIPPGAYTGGIYYGYDVRDDFNNPVKWCFNGISARNTFGWDYTDVDILPFIEEQGIRSYGNPNYFKGNVRLAFRYIQFGGGTGVGWYIDDVKLDVSRADSNPHNQTADAWRLVNTNWNYGPSWTHSARSGSNAWWNGDVTTGLVRTGIDNSLMTKPIDLTNARFAYLSAYFKFNLNTQSGAPPDGFRVEISSDGGVTWRSLNLGVRASWGVSGSGLDSEDGVMDGKAYTGIGDSGQGNQITDGYWVSAGSLSRLNVDVTPWRGHQVIIRFRMVTNNLPSSTYPHSGGNVGFGGFYVDDVIVYGETILG